MKHFNWSKRWKYDVEPYLQNKTVQFCIDFGMKLLEPKWESGDKPYVLGRGPINGQRAIKNKLSYYQPIGRCHHISFFAGAIGKLNYPELEWRIVSGRDHTIPVGYNDGKPHIIMDILLFKEMTAEKSYEFATKKNDNNTQWKTFFHLFETKVYPSLLTGTTK